MSNTCLGVMLLLRDKSELLDISCDRYWFWVLYSSALMWFDEETEMFFGKSSKIGWLSASSIVNLENGLNYRILSRKSIASVDDPGYLLAKSQRYLYSKEDKYCNRLLSCIWIQSFSSGVPITSKMVNSLSGLFENLQLIY